MHIGLCSGVGVCVGRHVKMGTCVNGKEHIYISIAAYIFTYMNTIGCTVYVRLVILDVQ